MMFKTQLIIRNSVNYTCSHSKHFNWFPKWPKAQEPESAAGTSRFVSHVSVTLRDYILRSSDWALL